MDKKSYYCMQCDWKVEETKRHLDGISCPKCKGHTIMPKK